MQKIYEEIYQTLLAYQKGTLLPAISRYRGDVFNDHTFTQLQKIINRYDALRRQPEQQ